MNTEHLRDLIRSRLGHIIAYENVFAKMVHERASYLRDCKAYENDRKVKQCCRGLIKAGEPKESKKVVVHRYVVVEMMVLSSLKLCRIILFSYRLSQGRANGHGKCYFSTADKNGEGPTDCVCPRVAPPVSGLVMMLCESRSFARKSPDTRFYPSQKHSETQQGNR